VFVYGLSAFALTVVLLILLAPLARWLGLVDRPNSRKHHHGEVPLIGGVAIFIGLLVLVPFFVDMSAGLYWYFAAAGLLVVAGVLDDRFNINVKLRIIIEVVAALMMIFGANLWVGDLGNLLIFRELHMPLWLSLPFTIIAVFGITNAWNMIDGMDGLVGTITLIALGSFYFLTHATAVNNVLPAMLIGGTAAYLLFNLGSNRLLPKVFLGDAGSKLIGFSLVWLLIDSTQGGSLTGMHLPAVLALFIVGLPLIDMVATILRRVKKGKSAYEPDRTHIHHVLQQAGFNHQEILLLIGVLSIQINFIGIVMYLLHWPSWAQFGIFFFITLLYFFCIDNAWKLGRWLQQQQTP
jgi:UDP-GlcNAc:undecaprenyl-phosphate GlcNAc-1-phosphate transferase